MFRTSQSIESLVSRSESHNPENCGDPLIVSEYVFRDVISRAAFGSIQSVVTPVVRYVYTGV